ncbi:MAG: hypothetical protein ACYC60_03690 [Thermoanaerobaculia bacterium]
MHLDLRGVRSELRQDRPDDAAVLPDERDEQVLRRVFGMSRLAGEVLPLDDRFLCLDCKFIDIHCLALVLQS